MYAPIVQNTNFFLKHTSMAGFSLVKEAIDLSTIVSQPMHSNRKLHTKLTIL